jgi:teichuronic acid biosynthesis glycosyltransferase TuaG
MNNISIIVPIFDKTHFFYLAIKSILQQTYKNFEVIVVFDSSNLKEFNAIRKSLKKYKKIRFINNGNNFGVAYSRNRALKLSNGKYVAFLDSDDLWHEKKLEYQINFMKINNLDFSHTSYNIINTKNKIIATRLAKPVISYKELLNSCDIGTSTVMLKKNILNNEKFKNLKTKEDYALWLALAKKNIKISGINKILVSWRKNPSSLSSSTFQKIKDAFKIYYEIEKFSFLYSIYRVFVLCFNFVVKDIKSRGLILK